MGSMSHRMKHCTNHCQVRSIPWWRFRFTTWWVSFYSLTTVSYYSLMMVSSNDVTINFLRADGGNITEWQKRTDTIWIANSDMLSHLQIRFTARRRMRSTSWWRNAGENVVQRTRSKVQRQTCVLKTDTFDEASAEELNGRFILSRGSMDRLELIGKTLHDLTIDMLCVWLAHSTNHVRRIHSLYDSETDAMINKTGHARMSPTPGWTWLAGHRLNVAARISRWRHQRWTGDNEQATHHVADSNGGGPRQNRLSRTPFPARRCTSKHTKQRKATNTAASTSATCRLKWGKKTR